MPRPARGGTHLRRRRHPARARLGPPQTPARASPSATARGAGSAPETGQSGAAIRRSWPILAVPPCPGWARRKHSRGIPPPRPALPAPPRRRGAVDLPTPPKAATGCTTTGRGGGTWGWAPANREEGRPATNGKLGPLDHVLLAECRSRVSGVVRGGRAGCGSQVTRAKFRAEGNSPHPEKLTL